MALPRRLELLVAAVGGVTETSVLCSVRVHEVASVFFGKRGPPLLLLFIQIHSISKGERAGSSSISYDEEFETQQ